MPDRVVGDVENDRDRRGRRLSGERRRRAPGCGDHGDAAPNQFGRKHRQLLQLIIGPPVFDRNVLALDVAGVSEALAKCAHWFRISLGRLRVEEPDHRHRRLLRARCERRCSRAPEQSDELAPLQLSKLHPQPTSQDDSIPDWQASNRVTAVRHFDPA
jgi:hypothetical protein